VSAEESAGQCYFLSYSRSDEQFALRLAKDLRAGGVAMWVDQLDIRPSEHWDKAIERAVRGCRGLVVVLSPRSVASDNVADEISFAIDSGKSVLPVMIERCTLPLRLTRMQVIDATGNYDRALEQCLDELKRRDGAPVARPAERPREALDPAELALAKERLAPILGPIAGRLVDKAAQGAGSTADLYRAVALRIDSEPERERFLKSASVGAADSQPPPTRKAAPKETVNPSIPTAELDTVAQLMTRYIGPIAPMVVKRESRSSGSFEDLCRQLAALIADPRERAEFLREAESR
jgi:TIR domain